MSSDTSLTSFVPSVETQRPYRNALGNFATGVTVITTKTADGQIGMTANSFASVSLDPALVLWSIAKSSLRYAHFAPATHFAIHVLRADQKDLAQAFAQRGDAFDLVDYAINAEGVAVLNDCLSRFECATHAVHEAGDHDIMVGHVLRAAEGSGSPLLFAQRSYGTVQPEV
ncbi:flavin reductase family protein [Shimia sp. MMG029]|uniref:flavin reductase family protein n=1 Tax=Shimia sp. MMG029 TaxID=3021978 RepID=UPI0022FDF59E|nr:flavin reductase family protein [Shimia sp. MMG029]MDA5555587.1 flavin reductase family protein [Shimia sp. MMG029]